MVVNLKVKPRRLLMMLLLHINSALLTFSIYSGNATTYEASGGFIVQLYHFSNFAGAGSLIHERFVLTAAHCIKSAKPEGYSVVYGATYLREAYWLIGKSAMRGKVVGMEVHSAFDPVQSENDIAVLILAIALRGPTIKPIPLSTRPCHGDELATALGWGETGAAYDVCLPLQQVQVPVLNWTKCRDQMRPKHGELHEGMLCTFSGDRRGICSGDSGGPLTVNGQLAGVIIWYANPGCGNGEMPDIHADVYYYRDFIATAMEKLTKSVELKSLDELFSS